MGDFIHNYWPQVIFITGLLGGAHRHFVVTARLEERICALRNDINRLLAERDSR